MEHKERKRLRISCFDYSNNGAYFVTLCTKNKNKVLCEIVGDDALVVPSKIGNKVLDCIKNIEIVYNGVYVDYFVIMPDHIHFIIFFDEIKKYDNTLNLPKIMKDFKSVTTRYYKKISLDNDSLWQRSYYEHIIRNEQDLYEIRNYIQNNPKRRICKD